MKRKHYDDCCYEEMTNGIGGQSIPSGYWNEPYCNNYENTRKGYDVNGLDQSDMDGNK